MKLIDKLPKLLPHHELELKLQMKDILSEMDKYESTDEQMGYLLNVIATHIIHELLNERE